MCPLMVLDNPSTPDWTILLVVIYYNSRIMTIFSWYTAVALPALFCERLVESFIATMVCKDYSGARVGIYKRHCYLKAVMGPIQYSLAPTIKPTRHRSSNLQEAKSNHDIPEPYRPCVMIINARMPCMFPQVSQRVQL